MELRQRRENGIDVFQLTGRVEFSGSFEFQKQVAAAIDAGARKIVMDLSGLVYISSNGLGVFALALERLAPLGGEMVFAGANSDIRHILETVGFARLFRSFPSVAAASKALAGQ